MTPREAIRMINSDQKFLIKVLQKKQIPVTNMVVSHLLKDNQKLLELEVLTLKKAMAHTKRRRSPLHSEALQICQEAVNNNSGDILQSLEEQLHSVQQWLPHNALSLLPELLKLFLYHSVRVSLQQNDHNMMKNAIMGFHRLKDLNMEQIFCQYSYVETILTKDPAGIYSKMDQPTKAFYRNECARQALASHQSETDYVNALLAEAETKNIHIGFPLMNRNNKQKTREQLGKGQLLCQWILPLLAAWMISLIIHFPLGVIFFYLPFHRLLRPLLQRIFTIGVQPYFMPRMDLEQEIPQQLSTLITVSAILPDASRAASMASHLEQLFLANNNGAVYVCLLADFPESKSQYSGNDNEQLQAITAEINRLNHKYKDHFILVIRPRTYSKTQNAYCGWERKRGALLQLARAIAGSQEDFMAVSDPGNHLPEIQYILALDQDSQLLFNGAYDLITAAAHPLNQPQIDPNTKTVVSGYGILSPRIVQQIQTKSSTLFARLYHRFGISSYQSPCSDLYQDLLGKTVFSGKGLLHVGAINACLQNTLPTERILSHDIIEGAFLRCGLVSDVEVADCEPENAVGWYKRQHRWIRGDFQNTIWLFNHYSNQKRKQRNPIAWTYRFMIADNLMRSLYSAATFLLIILAWLQPAVSLACIGTVLACFLLNETLAFIHSLYRQGSRYLQSKNYSNLLPSRLREWICSLFQIIFMATDAQTALSGAWKGLYRSFISHKKCMEWTTATQVSAVPKGSFLFYIRFNIFSVLSGLVLLVAPNTAIKCFGAVFLFAPFLQWITSKNKTAASPIECSKAERAFLLETGQRMWQFYVDTCTKEENYLPPDNLQEQPVYATAHRTSPTNIGLYLLSIVSAQDLGYISEQEMLERIEKTYQTTQKLARWNGHLLNWYDTKTAQPLFPKYCSTVDSGNYACCLTAVKNRLKEMDNPMAAALQVQMETELQTIDFRPLFHRHRNLFHIGFDLEQNKLSDSFYDMFMSECRLTSYFAIARRQIPPKHWWNLSRIMTQIKQHIGPLSWTGTAFEYLMAPIFLPVFPNTLSYEAVQFCIDSQIGYRSSKFPWGSSESGYYAFDDSLNYQYQPNGIPHLALKQYAKDELVISPYSTFLSLPFQFKRAMQNLHHLKQIKAIGKYGYYEAIDYTPSRCIHTKKEIICSYMAHHVGMSLCALENAINNNRVQQWFMKEENQGAKSLLMEAIPEGVSIYHQSFYDKVPQKPKVAKIGYHDSPLVTPNQPRYSLICNKNRRITANSIGEIESLWNNMLLYRTPQDFLANQGGVLVGLEMEDRTVFLTLSPHYEDSEQYQYQEFDNSILYSYKDYALSASVRIELSENGTTEFRTVTIKNKRNQPLAGRLFFYFEPLLHTKEQVRSHPAYCKLFLESRYDPNTNQLIFQKRSKSDESSALIVVGFSDVKQHYQFSCCKQSSIQYHNNRFRFHLPDQNDSAGTPDPCCMITLPIHLPSKAKCVHQLYLSPQQSSEEAKEAILADSVGQKAMVSLREKRLESLLAREILPCFFGACQENKRRFTFPALSRDHLWQCGISGDYPILCCQIRSASDLERLRHYMPAWKYLSKLGVFSDFAVLYHEYGDYSRQQHQQIQSILLQNNCQSMIGKSGGIHLVNIANSPDLKKAILAVCAYEITAIPKPQTQPALFSPIKLSHVTKTIPDYPQPIGLYGGYFSQNRFVVTKDPSVPWVHTLATAHFGTQVTNRSLGFTYAVNSRENRLTPWSNDPCTHYKGERLILCTGKEYYDLVDGSTAEFATHQICFHGQVHHIPYTITVEIIAMQKKITVSFEKPLPEKAYLAFYTEPVLDFDRKHAQQITGNIHEGIPVIHQPLNHLFDGWMSMASNSPMTVCFDAYQFWSGKWRVGFPPPNKNCCMAGIVTFVQQATFTLAYGKTEEEARNNAAPSLMAPARSKTNWHLQSQDPLLNAMVNHFLPHQVINDRLYARTGFYQCSGAFGFRDQLQDAGNLQLVFPHIARQQILRCCSRQFWEGDVLHWWHELPAGPAGVRTKCSDDLVWLPYTVARYVAATGDEEILKTAVPFLLAPILTEDETERYDNRYTVTEPHTVYEHCKRALSAIKISNRGLALIGSCDWNDGFSAVGTKGKGESVWLTQFVAMVCENFSHVALLMKELSYAEQLNQLADELKQAVETHCWDGDRYIRAFFDNGEAMGSKNSKENQLDVLPQAFAVFSNLPNHQRNQQAVLTAYQTLVDHQHQLIQLFSPPFDLQYAGYISTYPPGIRENGGQYTHGVIWLIQALFQLNETEKAYQLIRYISPAHHCLTEELATEYAGEPYAMAGDVYTHPDAVGRAGWTHYTGAAGWLYRIIWEDMLGCQQRGKKLIIQPHLPAALFQTRCRIKVGQTVINLQFQLTKPYYGAVEIPLDGEDKTVIISDR